MKRYRSRITAIFGTLQVIDSQCFAPDADVLGSIAALSGEFIQEDSFN
jgi:hypothetical protein